jgi:hypothetical protein
MATYFSEIDPLTCSENETRDVLHKMRANRPRKIPDVNTPRNVPSLPRLTCLGDWKPNILNRLSRF